MLIHAAVNDELMFAGRQYPFASKSGIDIVLNIYNNIMAEKGAPSLGFISTYGSWSNYYVDDTSVKHLGSRYFMFGRELFRLSQYVEPGMGARNYNDILDS